METWEERTAGLDELSRETYQHRVDRLVKEGYSEGVAKGLACGIPPADIKKWPPNLRYDLAGVERRGLSRDDAIKEIKRKLDEWWFNTHKYS